MQMHETYHTETRIVAFLDILGFRDQTKRLLDDPELLRTFDRALSSADMLAEPYLGYRTECRLFSDCICASSPFEPDNVWRFVYTVEAVQMNLACSGVFVRGGLAIGRHFENSRMIMSEALVEAYLLEKDVAIFPRIVATEQTISRVSDLLRLASQDNWDGGPFSIAGALDSHFRRDADGQRYLSYLMSLHRIDRSAIVDMYISDHKRSVESWIADGHQRQLPPAVRAKHEWVRNYHNVVLREMFPVPGVESDLIDANPRSVHARPRDERQS